MKNGIFGHIINAQLHYHGAAASDFTFSQRHTALLHLRVVDKTHCVGSVVGYINNSKDAAIFVFILLVLMEYHRTAYDRKTWLPLEVIQQATAEGWLDSLCYFVWLKSCHQKPIFYNYSLRRVAGQIHCSPTTLSHHLNILLAHGLCNRVGANLHLKSNKAFRAEHHIIVPVGIAENKAAQRDLLRFCIIKRNLHQQFRINRTKNEVLKYHTGEIKGYKTFKRIRRLAKKYASISQLESSVQNVLTLSNRKLGQLCARSNSTGMRIQKAFNQLNVLESIKRVEKTDFAPTNRRGFFELHLNASYFLSKTGQIYQRLSNELKLPNPSAKVLFQ